MYSCGQKISSRKRTQSRQHPVTGRQQSCSCHGKRAGHHRGLRAGRVNKRVIRELGRASRLLGNNRRNKGDRHNKHPGVSWPTRPADESTPARAGRDTEPSASTQGTARERQAHRPGRTKVVVATHSTAGQGAQTHLARTRGEPRPKGPTIILKRAREGNAGHDVCVKERQPGLRAQKAVSTNLARIAKESERRYRRIHGQQQSCRLVESLTARFLAREGHY